MDVKGKAERRSVYAWAMYDWANSAFATTVMAGFFPVMFKQYWSAGVAATESSLRLGMANSLASLLVALFAPVIGAVADRMGARKGFLLVLAALGVVATGALYLVAAGQWQVAAVVYVIAIVGFSGSIGFYDALLPGIAGKGELDRISALGFALGYLGGALLFAVNVLMVLHPEWFGLEGQLEAMRLSFLMVALWWAVFTLPLVVWVREPLPSGADRGWQGVVAGLNQFIHTFEELRRLRVVGTFLVAYWLYMDGVGTIMRMAIDYGLSLGFGSEGLLTALLVTQAVGFPAALAFGRLGERWGPKAGIYIGLAVYTGVCLWAYDMRTEREFYGLAIAVGLVQGGVQALSRSLYARIIPLDKSAEFFGFYNLLGRFAVIFGPLLMGWAGAVTGSSRLSVLTVVVLFAAGAWVLARVDLGEGMRNRAQ